jgi:hypothetical protein
MHFIKAVTVVIAGLFPTAMADALRLVYSTRASMRLFLSAFC